MAEEGKVERKKWIPLESNPDTFNPLTQKLTGSDKLEWHEILSTEEWALDMVPNKDKCMGVVLLYPLTEVAEKARADQEASCTDGPYTAVSSPYVLFFVNYNFFISRARIKPAPVDPKDLKRAYLELKRSGSPGPFGRFGPQATRPAPVTPRLPST